MTSVHDIDTNCTTALTLSLSKGQADGHDGWGFDKLSLSAFSSGVAHD